MKTVFINSNTTLNFPCFSIGDWIEKIPKIFYNNCTSAFAIVIKTNPTLKRVETSGVRWIYSRISSLV